MSDTGFSCLASSSGSWTTGNLPEFSIGIISREVEAEDRCSYVPTLRCQQEGEDSSDSEATNTSVQSSKQGSSLQDISSGALSTPYVNDNRDSAQVASLCGCWS